MTPEILAGIVAVILSLLFSYVPWFASWYQALEADVKRLVMVGFLFLAAVGIFGLACLGWYETPGVVCTTAGAIGLFKIFISALIANQATFAISPKKGYNDPIWLEKYEARQGSGRPKKTWTSPKDK